MELLADSVQAILEEAGGRGVRLIHVIWSLYLLVYLCPIVVVFLSALIFFFFFFFTALQIIIIVSF